MFERKSKLIKQQEEIIDAYRTKTLKLENQLKEVKEAHFEAESRYKDLLTLVKAMLSKMPDMKIKLSYSDIMQLEDCGDIVVTKEPLEYTTIYQLILPKTFLDEYFEKGKEINER